MLFLQQLLNGLALGGVYAMFTMGFALIFSVFRIPDMAYGQYYMLAAFIAWSLAGAVVGIPLPLAILVGGIGGGVAAVAAKTFFFGPLTRRGGSELSFVVGSIAIMQILIAVGRIVWGPDARNYPKSMLVAGEWEVGGLSVNAVQVLMLGVSALFAVGLLLALRFTWWGLRLRAVAERPDVAVRFGINPSRIMVSTFFLAGLLAGSAGVLTGAAFNQVWFLMGESILLRAFTISILGGLGSISGALLGGILLGVAEVMTVAYLGASYRDAVVFGLLILILLLRPQGLLGRSAASARA